MNHVEKRFENAIERSVDIGKIGWFYSIVKRPRWALIELASIKWRD